jgi:glutamyl-tRNA synthetase
MLRYAPSPTADMHVGDLRIAIFNYIISKQKNEDFIIRIEDENIEGKDKEFLDLLNLFKIEYSQLIYQSENVRFHTAMALQLMHEKKAFSCFCSDNWLEKKREEARIANEDYKYDDACKNLPDELVLDNTSPFRIRLKKPEKSITDNIDSFVIMTQNKTPTNDFACAVDDMLSDISFIVRSDELRNNTTKQIHIRNSLSYDKKIKYIHLANILNADNIFSVKELLEEGFLPEAISNYLISVGNELPKKIFNIDDAIKWLDIEKISKRSTIFDINELREINREHLNNLDNKELSRYVGFADEEIGKLAKVYLKKLSTTKELKSSIGLIFSDKKLLKEFKKSSKIIIEIIKNAPYFEVYNDFKLYIMKESGLDDENVSKELRYLLTGAKDGPDISEIYKYLKNYIGEVIK